MTLRELFESKLVELKMSPSNIRALAAQIQATVGIEFEMIVKGYRSDNDGSEQPARSFDDIEDFFGDENSSRTLNRVITSLTEKYASWVRDEVQNEWDSAQGEQWFVEWLEENVQDSYIIGALNLEPGEPINYQDFAEHCRTEDTYWYDQAFVEYAEYQQDRNHKLSQAKFLEEHNLDTMGAVYEQYQQSFLAMPSDIDQETYDRVASSVESLLDKKTVASDQYHGAGRGPGTYIVEPDSSISPDNEYQDLAVEIVGPPQSVTEALADYRKIRSWAIFRDHYTNSSTGLHINISIPGYREDRIDYLKLLLLSGDEHILKQFGRQHSSYASNALKRIKNNIEAIQDPTKSVAELKLNLDELAKKYTKQYMGQSHLSVVIKLNRIEVRSPGGNWLKFDPDIIENTVYRYIVALDAAMNPAKYREDYLKKLYQVLDPGMEPVHQQVFKFYAGAISKSEFKQLMQIKYKSGLAKPAHPVTETEMVAELFDRPLVHSPLKWDGANRVAWFYVDDMTYVFLAKDQSTWNIEFFLVNSQPDAETMAKYPWGINAWRQIKPKLEEFGTTAMTQTGNSFKVISTVVDLFIMFLSEEHPKEIQFSAKTQEKGRIKLYRRLASQAATEFNYRAQEYQGKRLITWKLIRL